MAAIWELIMDNIFAIIGVTGIGGIFGLILKKFIHKDVITKNLDKWLIDNGKHVQAFFGGLGRALTLNATRWPVIDIVWNKIIEPLLIFGIQLLFKTLIWFFQNAIEGFVNRGLLSDHPNFAGETKSEAKASAKVLNK